MPVIGHKSAIRKIRTKVRAATKLKFLRDFQAQVEEDGDIDLFINSPVGKPQRVAVTFDRKTNDSTFSYSYLDLLLTVLDRAHGGPGILKPCNQVRTLVWRGDRHQLLAVLRYFSTLHATLKFRRLMVLPCPNPVVGWRIDPAIYKSLP